MYFWLGRRISKQERREIRGRRRFREIMKEYYDRVYRDIRRNKGVRPDSIAERLGLGGAPDTIIHDLCIRGILSYDGNRYNLVKGKAVVPYREATEFVAQN